MPKTTAVFDLTFDHPNIDATRELSIRLDRALKRKLITGWVIHTTLKNAYGHELVVFEVELPHVPVSGYTDKKLKKLVKRQLAAAIYSRESVLSCRMLFSELTPMKRH